MRTLSFRRDDRGQFGDSAEWVAVYGSLRFRIIEDRDLAGNFSAIVWRNDPAHPAARGSYLGAGYGQFENWQSAEAACLEFLQAAAV